MQWTASAYNTPEQTAIMYYTATKYGRDFCELLCHEKMENFVKNPPKDSSYDLIITEIIKRKQDKCLTLWLKHETRIPIYFIKNYSNAQKRIVLNLQNFYEKLWYGHFASSSVKYIIVGYHSNIFL